MEYTAKAQTISMEYALLNAQLALERQKAKSANQELDAYDALRDRVCRSRSKCSKRSR